MEPKIKIYGIIGADTTINDVRDANGKIVEVDSYGGDLDMALSMINELSGKVESVRYTGTSASAATILASGLGVTVEAYPNISLLIHEARVSDFSGKAAEMADYAGYMEKLNNTAAEIYAKKTGRPIQEMRALMASNNGEGKWLTAEEALEIGFIDKIIDRRAQIAAFYSKTKNDLNTKLEPMNFLSFFKSQKMTATKTKGGTLLSEKPLAVGVSAVMAESGEPATGTFETEDGKKIEAAEGVVTAMTDTTGMTIEEVAAKLAEIEAENEILKAKLAEYESEYAEMKAQIEAAAKVVPQAAATPRPTMAATVEPQPESIAKAIAKKTAQLRAQRKNKTL